MERHNSNRFTARAQRKDWKRNISTSVETFVGATSCLLVHNAVKCLENESKSCLGSLKSSSSSTRRFPHHYTCSRLNILIISAMTNPVGTLFPKRAFFKTLRPTSTHGISLLFLLSATGSVNTMPPGKYPRLRYWRVIISEWTRPSCHSAARLSVLVCVPSDFDSD